MLAQGWYFSLHLPALSLSLSQSLCTYLYVPLRACSFTHAPRGQNHKVDSRCQQNSRRRPLQARCAALNAATAILKCISTEICAGSPVVTLEPVYLYLDLQSAQTYWPFTQNQGSQGLRLRYFQYPDTNIKSVAVREEAFEPLKTSILSSDHHERTLLF